LRCGVRSKNREVADYWFHHWPLALFPMNIAWAQQLG
jgi:hypothetical protein